MAARALASVFLIVLIAACGRGAEPPRPTVSRMPSIIGVVTQWDFLDCTPGRYTLASGHVVAIVDTSGTRTGCGDPGGTVNRFYTPTPRLSENGFLLSRGRAEPGEAVEGGDLLFYGEDQGGSWFAAANPGRDSDCPYEMRGGAYDAGDTLHFSSGLVLQKAPTFEIQNDWVENPFPLRPSDDICVNELGEALSAYIWLPY